MKFRLVSRNNSLVKQGNSETIYGEHNSPKHGSQLVKHQRNKLDQFHFLKRSEYNKKIPRGSFTTR